MLQLLSLFLPVNAIPQKATAADAALIAIPSSATPTPPKISSTKRTAAPKKVHFQMQKFLSSLNQNNPFPVLLLFLMM